MLVRFHSFLNSEGSSFTIGQSGVRGLFVVKHDNSVSHRFATSDCWDFSGSLLIWELAVYTYTLYDWYWKFMILIGLAWI